MLCIWKDLKGLGYFSINLISVESLDHFEEPKVMTFVQATI